jgi:ligand-binding sensor domain-containing protein
MEAGDGPNCRNRGSLPWCAGFLLLALLAAPGPAAGGRFFSRSDGLPGSRILALHQDEQGRIWAGTDHGVARYDGAGWEAFTIADGLPGNMVYSLGRDPDGALWFGTSGGVGRLKEGSWGRLGVPEQARGGRISVLMDRERSLWIGTAVGLYVFDFVRKEFSRADDLPFRTVTGVFLDREDVLWVAGESGLARHLGRKWQELTPGRGAVAPAVRAGLQDRQGNWWFATPQGLVEFTGTSFRQVGGRPGDPLLTDATSLAEDAAGRLWVGTPRGVLGYDGYDWTEPGEMAEWPDRRVNALLADREGNLWVGTDSGVARLGLAWRTYPEGRHPYLRDRGGTLWYGVADGVEALNGRSRERFDGRDGFTGVLQAMAEDGEGTIWMGTDRGLVECRDRRLSFHSPPEPETYVAEVREGYWESRQRRVPDQRHGLTGESVASLLWDAEERLWVATEGGLSALERGRWSLFPGQAALGEPVTALAGGERVWAGTSRGVLLFQEGEWRPAPAGGPGGKFRITSFLEEGPDHLWVGTEGGLWEYRKDGWRRHRQEEGLLSERVTSLHRDRRGILWVGTRSGIALYNGSEWSSLDQKDGLPGVEILSLGGGEGEDLLVAGASFLASYRPDRTPPETLLKNQPWGPVSSPQLLLEYGGADLSTEPFDLRFSWRLDGGPWSPYTREPLVTLSDLANGAHLFEVRALDRHLNVDPTPAAVSFEVNTALFDVEVRDLTLQTLYAALYRCYASDACLEVSPVGQIRLLNRYDRPLRVKVGVTIPRLMDFPSDRVVTIAPGEEVTVPLRLELNESVLEQRENSVEQLLVSLQYYLQGEMKENKFTRGVSLVGRNAMTWADPRRIGLYVAHLDPDVERLARRVINAGKGNEAEYVLDDNFIRAVELFAAIGGAGVHYLPDPDHPYTGLGRSDGALDFIRFPRETLAVRSGDCDDIAVLYAALLQSVGVDTALVDVGDHVFLLVDTGLKGDRFRRIAADPRLVHQDQSGRIWVPVETTLVGRPFTEAWSRGAAELAREPKRIVAVRGAWEVYPPVPGALSTPFPPLEGLAEDAVRRARTDLGAAEDGLLGGGASVLKERLRRDPADAAAANDLGVLLGRRGYYRHARKWLEEVIRLRPDFAGGYSNLANVLYERGDYAGAVANYTRALELEPGNSQIHVEIALTYAEMGEFALARRHYLMALRIEPSLADLLR